MARRVVGCGYGMPFLLLFFCSIPNTWLLPCASRSLSHPEWLLVRASCDYKCWVLQGNGWRCWPGPWEVLPDVGLASWILCLCSLHTLAPAMFPPNWMQPGFRRWSCNTCSEVPGSSVHGWPGAIELLITEQGSFWNSISPLLTNRIGLSLWLSSLCHFSLYSLSQTSVRTVLMSSDSMCSAVV